MWRISVVSIVLALGSIAQAKEAQSEGRPTTLEALISQIETTNPELLPPLRLSSATEPQVRYWFQASVHGLNVCASAYRAVHAATVERVVSEEDASPAMIARNQKLARVQHVCDAWYLRFSPASRRFLELHPVPDRALDALDNLLDKAAGGAKKKAREAAIAAAPGGNPWWAEDLANETEYNWLSAKTLVSLDLTSRRLEAALRELANAGKPRQ